MVWKGRKHGIPELNLVRASTGISQWWKDLDDEEWVRTKSPGNTRSGDIPLKISFILVCSPIFSLFHAHCLFLHGYFLSFLDTFLFVLFWDCGYNLKRECVMDRFPWLCDSLGYLPLIWLFAITFGYLPECQFRSPFHRNEFANFGLHQNWYPPESSRMTSVWKSGPVQSFDPQGP